MTTQTLESVLIEHPFVKDLPAGHIELILHCASERVFAPGEYLSREGEQADVFYLIRAGRVSLEIHSPQGGGLRIETLGDGDVLGWSWIVEPYRWHFDARALNTVRAVALDGKALRGLCDVDPVLGYRLLRRFARLMEHRLNSTRLQLLDVYGSRRENGSRDRA
jgi:CRP-like cAMP-binding protein